jgi:predicted dithiol-disulfide oxidoreductase (DUF899 family)
MLQSRVVSREDWIAARKVLLIKEKELTRLRDDVSRRRRELPRVKVEKSYVFDTPAGKESLADLFEGRSQLIVKHFMFGPKWEEGCVGCSFEVDHVEGALVHLEHHDVSYVAVSRAPLERIEAYRKRMGWRFKWVSSHRTDFNFDYQVSFPPDDLAKGRIYYNYQWHDESMDEMSGLSVFYQDAKGDIFHTYSTYARGAEEVIGTYMYLDLTPKGRNETGPSFDLTDWARRHDRYEDGDLVSLAALSSQERQP